MSATRSSSASQLRGSRGEQRTEAGRARPPCLDRAAGELRCLARTAHKLHCPGAGRGCRWKRMVSWGTLHRWELVAGATNKDIWELAPPGGIRLRGSSPPGGSPAESSPTQPDNLHGPRHRPPTTETSSSLKPRGRASGQCRRWSSRATACARRRCELPCPLVVAPRGRTSPSVVTARRWREKVDPGWRKEKQN